MTVDALNTKLSDIWPRRWPKDYTEKNGFTGFKGAQGQILCTSGDYKQVTFHIPLNESDDAIFSKACRVIREVELSGYWAAHPPQSGMAHYQQYVSIKT